MTDTSPGPGWWLASDGNWYPPHLHPNARAAATAEPPAASEQAATTSVAQSAAVDATWRGSPGADTGAPALGHHANSALLAPYGASTGDAALSRTAAFAAVGGSRVGDSIDWAEVARQRAEQRAARQRSEAARRRLVALAAIGTLAVAGVIAAALLLRGDDAPGSAGTDTTIAGTASPTTAAVGTTSAAPGIASSTTADTISVFSLQPGACIDQENLTTGLVTSVRTVPCIVSHTHEVYYRAAFTPINSPFDAAKVTDFANKTCTEAFTNYVGVPYEQSKFYYVHLAPSEESWNKNRDRDVVCLLLLEGQRLTSSVKGRGE